MNASAGSDALLELLTEPTFVIRHGGEVLAANAAARRLLGADPAARSLFDYVADEGEELRALLRRSSGTTSPLVGAVTLRTGNGPSRHRVHSARLRGGGGGDGVRLALRCFAAGDADFSLLARRIKDLNAQLRRRLHENAVLEEALRQNTTLLRELQHRVKNNIQMMMSLIEMSAKGRDEPKVLELVETAGLRLQAMAGTQETIYRSRHASSVCAGEFLAAVARPIVQVLAPCARLHLDVAEAGLSHETAHCLALIVNELLTNALKHAVRDGGDVWLSLTPAGGNLELVVRDSGPGLMPDAVARASGLALVRGLCRQISGSFEVTSEGGTCCTVLFSREN